MKTLAAAALISLAIVATAAAQDNLPTLSASGEGIENAAPDVAVITLGVLSQAPSAREALNVNNTDMDEVIHAVRGQAVADKDISTTGFSISPLYSQPMQPRDGSRPVEPEIVAYQVSNQVRIVVRDIDKTGAVVDSAVSAGANQAGSINFEIEERQALAEKAIAKAIADARHKAELMAAAAGVRLVRILTVNANESGGGPIYRLEAARASAAPPVPVMGGELSVKANAQISWEIAPQ